MKKYLIIIIMYHACALNLCAQTYYAFSSVRKFHEGFCVVSKGEKYGVVNKNGDLVIPFEYDKVEDCSEGFFSVCKNYKCGYIDTLGRVVIAMKYDKCYSFSEGKAVVELNGDDDPILGDKRNGVINKNGEFVIPFDKYYTIDSYNGGLARAQKYGKGYVYINEKGEDIITPFPKLYKLSFFKPLEDSSSWTPIIAFPYSDTYEYEFEDSVFVYDKNGFVKKEKNYGLWDGALWSEGKLPLYKVKDRKMVYGVIDTSFKFKDLNVCGLSGIKGGRGEFLDTITKKRGVIDVNGDVVVSPIYDMINISRRDLNMIVKKDKWGLIDKNGNVIVDFVYDRMWNVTSKTDIYIVRLNEKEGLIDSRGTKIVDCVYDQIRDIGEQRFAVYENGKFGIINYKGEVIIPPQFEYVKSYSEGYLPVKKNGLFGFVDTNGIPMQIRFP